MLEPEAFIVGNLTENELLYTAMMATWGDLFDQDSIELTDSHVTLCQEQQPVFPFFGKEYSILMYYQHL